MLPGAQPHAGWNLETWNRDFGVPIRFGDMEPDGYRSLAARADDDGLLVLDGGAEPTKTLVVNDYGSAVELDGRVIERPRPGLALWQLRGEPRVRSLAEGVYHDGWASAITRYRVWGRAGGGTYAVQLSLPPGRPPRTVTLSVDGGGTRTVALGGGERVRVHVPSGPAPTPRLLEIRTDRADFAGGGGPAPRLVAVRVSDLSYTVS